MRDYGAHCSDVVTDRRRKVKTDAAGTPLKHLHTRAGWLRHGGRLRGGGGEGGCERQVLIALAPLDGAGVPPNVLRAARLGTQDSAREPGG